MDRKEALKECGLFRELSEADLEKVVGSILEKQFEAGTTIFQQGENAEELLIVQEGRVALQMTLPKVEGQFSRRVTVDIVNHNEIIGWSAVVEPNIYTFSAVCLQRVKALSISGNKLRALLKENPMIGYKVLNQLIKVVASRLNDTTQVLVSERLLTNIGV